MAGCLVAFGTAALTMRVHSERSPADVAVKAVAVVILCLFFAGSVQLSMEREGQAGGWLHALSAWLIVPVICFVARGADSPDPDFRELNLLMLTTATLASTCWQARTYRRRHRA